MITVAENQHEGWAGRGQTGPEGDHQIIAVI